MPEDTQPQEAPETAPEETEAQPEPHEDGGKSPDYKTQGI
jgi:hypothetical protein